MRRPRSSTLRLRTSCSRMVLPPSTCEEANVEACSGSDSFKLGDELNQSSTQPLQQVQDGPSVNAPTPRPGAGSSEVSKARTPAIATVQEYNVQEFYQETRFCSSLAMNVWIQCTKFAAIF